MQSGSGGGGSGSSSTPSAVSQNQTVSTIAPWAQPGVSNLINQQMANMFPNQTTNADGSINLGQQAGYSAFGMNGAGIGPNQVAAAQQAVAGFSPLQQQAQQAVGNLQMPGQYGTATGMATAAGENLMNSAKPAMAYGSLGSAMGTAAAGMAPQAQQYGSTGAQIGTQGGLGYGAQGFQAGQGAAGYGAMGARQGASYGQNATDAQAVQQYMNPYLRATLDPAMQLQQQQFGQINAQNQGQATQQGAFGGGRQAVTQGLNQQNQMLAQNQLTSNAYNQAYNTANQNMQQAAALGMQGSNLGIQGQQAAITGANTGLQGVNTALAGQQLGLSGLNTANSLYNTGISGAQTGLAGVNAAQAGYTGANAAAANLSNIGTQQQAAQLGIINAQNQLGNQQQANQQAVINQAMQNYSNTQNYPMQQAYNLMGLYTGAPTAQTQTNYMAPPSAVNTAANAAMGTYAASKLVAKGGLMKTKDYAAGGQVAFDVGGAVEADLYDMDDARLMQTAKTSPSMEIRKDAMRILAERQMEKRAMNSGVGASPMAQGMQMAGGGIVAFAKGDVVDEGYSDTGIPLITPSYVGNLAAATPGSREFLGLPPKEETKEKSKEKTTLKPDELGRYIAASEPAPKTGLGATPQARPTTTSQKAASTDNNALSNVESYIKKLETMGYGVPTEERKALTDQFKADREEAKVQKKEDFMMGLLAAAGKGMSATSPFANVGIGQTMQGVGEGAAYANKNYNEAIKAAQSGQLDIAKLNNADRTNLLHYAVTGAVSDSNTRTKMAELAEIAKTRAAGSGQANLARQDAAITARAKLILGNNPMPTAEDVDNAIRTATQQVSGKSMGPSAQDQQALAWAKANPKDPRSATILQRLGG